jgi:hypothetical protein
MASSLTNCVSGFRINFRENGGDYEGRPHE